MNFSVYVKLPGRQDVYICGDEEGRNDDHVFWLEAAEAERERERRLREKKNQGDVTALPSCQQGNEKSICNAALHSCMVITEMDEERRSSSAFFIRWPHKLGSEAKCTWYTN